MNPLFARLTFMLALLLSITGCSHFNSDDSTLTSINIIDRNGMSETISTPDRLKQYSNVDFLENQPYQKVLRIYSRDAAGNIYACITSYHPNGHIRQYLEVINNRAFGAYREWHENGIMKLDTYIIGGEADINTSAEKSWLFDGCSQVWDEENNLVAQIQYVSGELEGFSTYYHPNGMIWKLIPYHAGQIEGNSKVFLTDGTLLQETEFINGIKEGISRRYWDGVQLAADEYYESGLLNNASYYSLSQQPVAQIKGGQGYRATFGKDSISELQQYQNGVLEGEVKVFDADGALARIYHIKNELKNGEEIEYFPPLPSRRGELQPRLSIMWIDGRIQGPVKTWYSNGIPESQREMSRNAKNGLLTAWYDNGSVMMIEQYDRDKLIKGEYFERGEKIPVSQISNGKGTATIFDTKGTLLRRVPYNNGKPAAD